MSDDYSTEKVWKPTATSRMRRITGNRKATTLYYQDWDQNHVNWYISVDSNKVILHEICHLAILGRRIGKTLIMKSQRIKC